MRRGQAPLAVGDRILLRGVRTRTPGDERPRDAVVDVVRVDAQFCGCWRITANRPDGPAPALEASGQVQVYGSVCPWPHLDRIDYAAARAAARAAG